MTHETLAAALSAAQGEFNGVPKGGTNPHFRSKFPELADAVKTAAPVLAKHGLSVSQLVDYDDLDETLTTILMHSSGQELRARMRLRPTKNDPQSLGSAITYARRYSYMAILGLAADDDDGQAASSPTQFVPAPEQHKPDASKTANRESTAVQESALIPSAKAKQHLLDHLEATGLDPLRSREVAVQLWDEAHLTSAPITEDTLQTLYGWADGIAAE